MTTAGSRSTFAYAYLSLGALIGVVASQQLPVVNLTYQAYRASSYNVSWLAVCLLAASVTPIDLAA